MPNSPLECPARGTQVGSVQCPNCSHGRTLKVYGCVEHPEGCTVGNKADGYYLCDGGFGTHRDRFVDTRTIVERLTMQRSRPAPQVTWAYGVTTVPDRRDDLLPRTLQSLKAAGFDRPRLFVDGIDAAGGLSYQREFPDLEVTVRSPRIRTYGNWTLALAELYLRSPDAMRFALFQDDCIAASTLRDYLDRCAYPEKGYWNLFTMPKNQRIAPKNDAGGTVDGWFQSNQMGLGAVGLVFDRPTVVTLLTHQHMVDRPQDPFRGWRAIDGGIVSALKKAGWTEWVHSPSLVQHTGRTSSMGNRPQPSAESFRGEDYDLLQLLEVRETSAAYGEGV